MISFVWMNGEKQINYAVQVPSMNCKNGYQTGKSEPELEWRAKDKCGLA